MKKLLSILFIFLLALPTVQVSAEEESPAVYTPSAEAVAGQELLNSLGIETVYDNYTDNASRGELLSLIMQLMNTKDFNTDVSPFRDVSASEPLAAYTTTALELGIISPSDSFSPSRTVLMSEAAKMGVVALGYAHEAILLGGYPAGYLAYADKLGLFDSMTAPDADVMTVGDMYVFLKNMTETDIRVQTAFGDEEEYTSTEGVNLITYYHDLYEVIGIIEANEYTSLYDPDIKADTGSVMIDSVQYRYNGNLTVGENIKAYVKDTGTVDSIVYAYPEDTDKICVSGYDISYIDGNKISINGSDGKEYTVRTTDRPAVIYNGHASANIANLSEAQLAESEITFISSDGSGKYNVINIMQSSPFIVSGTSKLLSKIYAKSGTGTLTIDDEDKDFLIYVDGERADISQIKENTVADVYISENGSLVTVKISSGTINGTVTGYAPDDKYIYIDDVKYVYTDYFESYYKNNASIGSDITAYISAAGGIVATDSFISGSMKYGYFLQTGKKSGLDSEIYARVFTADGKYRIFTLADKVSIDGISGITPEKAASDYLTDEQLIRYSINSESEINKIDTAYSHNDRANNNSIATTGFIEDGADAEDNLIRYSFPGEDGIGTVYFKYNAMHPHFSLSSSSIIFVVDKSLNLSDEKRCMVTTRKSYANDQKFPSNTIRPYNVSTNGNAEVMVEYSAATTSLSGEGAKYGVVQSFNRAITPDGEKAIKLVVHTANDVTTAYLKDETLMEDLYQPDVNKAVGELPVGPGDIVRCAVSTSNEIGAITIDYDYSQKKVINSFTGTNVLRSDYQGYMYAYNPEDAIIFLANTMDYSKIETASKIAVFTWGAACIFDSETGIVYPAKLSDVITYEKDPANCDFVHLRVNWAQGNLAVIYR